MALNVIRHGTFMSFIQSNFPHKIAAAAPCTHTLKILQHKSSNVDALDIFTTNFLVKQDGTPKVNFPNKNVIDARVKVLKKIASQQARKTTLSTEIDVDIEKWSQNEIDHYLTIVMDCDDRSTFIGIVKQMIDSKRLPSEAIILRTLSYLCDDNDDSMTTISRLIDVCQEQNLPFYARNMEFSPFLAQYLWKLKRFDDALHILQGSMYTTNEATKNATQQNYRQIIYDAITVQDDSVLDKLIAHAKKVYDEQKDGTIIMYVWGDCFFSQLFRNQLIANELFAKYQTLRTGVSNDIGRIALSLMQRYDVDGMYRLIEQCLEFKMKSECRVCLSALFDYQCTYQTCIDQ